MCEGLGSMAIRVRDKHLANKLLQFNPPMVSQREEILNSAVPLHQTIKLDASDLSSTLTGHLTELNKIIKNQLKQPAHSFSATVKTSALATIVRDEKGNMQGFELNQRGVQIDAIVKRGKDGKIKSIALMQNGYSGNAIINRDKNGKMDSITFNPTFS